MPAEPSLRLSLSHSHCRCRLKGRLYGRRPGGWRHGIFVRGSDVGTTALRKSSGPIQSARKCANSESGEDARSDEREGRQSNGVGERKTQSASLCTTKQAAVEVVLKEAVVVGRPETRPRGTCMCVWTSGVRRGCMPLGVPTETRPDEIRPAGVGMNVGEWRTAHVRIAPSGAKPS